MPVMVAGVLLSVLAWICGSSSSVVMVAHADSHDAKAAGAVLFHEKGCEHCHGVDGKGGELGPDLSEVGKRRDKAGIQHQIREGGGGMPAFGDVLQPDEVTDLVEYLHAKRGGKKR